MRTIGAPLYLQMSRCQTVILPREDFDFLIAPLWRTKENQLGPSKQSSKSQLGFYCLHRQPGVDVFLVAKDNDHQVW